MATGKTAIATMIAVVIAAALLGPIATSVSDTTGTQSVTNETVTADYDKAVELDGYQLDGASVTVYGLNETSGNYEEAVEGSDYEINQEPGTIEALSGSTLIDDGEEVKVTYDYEASDATTTLVAGLVPLLVAVLILATLGMKVQEMM